MIKILIVSLALLLTGCSQKAEVIKPKIIIKTRTIVKTKIVTPKIPSYLFKSIIPIRLEKKKLTDKNGTVDTVYLAKYISTLYTDIAKGNNDKKTLKKILKK